MGSLLLGKILFKLIFGAVKATPKVVKATKDVSATVREVVEKIQPKITEVTPQTINRQELKRIYEDQKQVVARHSEVATHIPYVITRTTVLSNYLTENDWQELAADQLNEEQVLQRIERSFDNDLHQRLSRAAHRVGFVNTRKQVRTGVQQVATYSDGQGHGVRIAIRHEEDTEIGIDLVGHKGQECHTKREELVKALAEEGLTLQQIRVIYHNDPDGYKAEQKTKQHTRQQRRQQLRHQLLHQQRNSRRR